MTACIAASVQRWRSVEKVQLPTSELLESFVQSSSRARAVARMNEQLGEIESMLDSGRNVPAAASRIAAFTGLLFASLELAETMRSAGGPAWRSAIGLAALGASAAVLIRLFGRRADEVVWHRRAAWNGAAADLRRRLDARFPE